MENRKDIRQIETLETLIYRLQFGEPRDFINELLTKYASSKDTDKLIDAVLNIEFVDSEIGYDPETTMSNAFFYGTLIGIHIVDSLHPEGGFRKRTYNKINQMINVSFDETDSIPDKNNARVAFAQKMIDCGRDGCDRYPAYSSAVENMEDRFIKDATKSPYMRLGMGYVLFAMDIASNEQLEADIANGTDWNAGLEILNNELNS